MPNVELILGLLVAVALLTTIARQLGVAYPVLLVLGGMALSFIPGVPVVELPPELVLVLFLPPLLFWESINLSYRDLRLNLRPILNLAIGLVFATIAAVAFVAHRLIPGFGWATAFVLGATVGPTDEIAVTALAERFPVPMRVLTIIEDESLLNDASALVAYNVTVAAVVTGAFSLAGTGVEFLAAGAGGIAIGLAVGWAVTQLFARLDDPPVENTISLLAGFAAYLPADALNLSGVLAVVATGIYLSRQSGHLISARTRLQGRVLWQMVDFLVNGVLFILVGLQLHRILGEESEQTPATLIRYTLIIVLTVVLMRIGWVFAGTYLPRLLFPGWAKSRPAVSRVQTAIIAWTGTRGAVSLAAALAIPLAVNNGAPFPNRDLIIYLTFAVILATLVLQGLTLPYIIRRLEPETEGQETAEELAARLAATQAGLERLNSSARDGLPPELFDGLRRQLQERSRRFVERRRGSQSREQRVQRTRYRRLLQEILDAERNAVLDLRDQGIISDDVMRKVERELDLDEVRLEPEDGAPDG